jgi:hypothetical protein
MVFDDFEMDGIRETSAVIVWMSHVFHVRTVCVYATITRMHAVRSLGPQ